VQSAIEIGLIHRSEVIECCQALEVVRIEPPLVADDRESVPADIPYDGFYIVHIEHLCRPIVETGLHTMPLMKIKILVLKRFRAGSAYGLPSLSTRRRLLAADFMKFIHFIGFTV
jgi:hypothetical protein